ncbi:MAG: DUF3078 domain-containing protein [Bacteroidales bacterium]|nr:DUF3078 domain-containing protein [Bacteroidales bacterium]
MKKHSFLFVIIFLCSFFAISQTDTTAVKNWKITNLASVNINQTGYTQWAGGGQNSFSLGTFNNFSATYTKNHYLFDCYANLGYGMMKQQSDDFWRKTDDKIDVMVNNGWKWKANNASWYYGALFTMTSQFAHGYNYDLGEPSESTLKSTTLSPAYFNLAPGVTYRYKERFSWFFSPCNGRMLLIADQRIADLGLYGNTMEARGINGNPVGKKVDLGMGIFTEIRWKQPLVTGIDIDTKLRISNNYLDKRTDNHWNFDIDYLLLLNFKVNKYISANLRLEILYDDDTHITRKDDKVGPVLQLKEIIGIGFAWNFTNQK